MRHVHSKVLSVLSVQQNTKALPGIPKVHCVRVRGIISRVQAELMTQIAALSFIQLLTGPKAVLRPLPSSRRHTIMLICESSFPGIAFGSGVQKPMAKMTGNARGELSLHSTAELGQAATCLIMRNGLFFPGIRTCRCRHQPGGTSCRCRPLYTFLRPLPCSRQHTPPPSVKADLSA